MKTLLKILLLFSLSRKTLLSVTAQIPEDLNLKSQLVSFNGKNFNQFELFLGSSFDERNDPFETLIDFEYSESIIGSLDLSGWGVDCSKVPEFAKNSCIYTDSNLQQDYYLGVGYSYIIAEAFIKLDRFQNLLRGTFFSRFVIRPEFDSSLKINLRVVSTQSNEKWPANNMAMIGLNPQSHFINYLLKIYKKSISWTLVYSKLSSQLLKPEANEQ